MSYSDWFRWISAFTLQAIVWLLVANIALGVWSLYQQNVQRYAEYQEDTKANEQQAARDIARKCNIIAPPFNSLGECLVAQIEAYVEERDTNQDLQAQQDMAFWAAALFWLSSFTAIVSVAGLILVYRSLRQTRTAIKDNREIGEAEVRAYIGIENSRQHPFVLEKLEVGEKACVTFRYSNNGGSPANFVTYVAFCEVRDHPIQNVGPVLVAPALDQEIPPNTIQRSGGGYGEAFTERALSEVDIKDIVQGKKKRLYMMCRIEYDDVFNRRHYTHGCFYLEFATPPAGQNSVINAQWFAAPTHNDAN